MGNIESYNRWRRIIIAPIMGVLNLCCAEGSSKNQFQQRAKDGSHLPWSPSALAMLHEGPWFGLDPDRI